ncbi:hypothetical protein [Allocoleopsis franciscana]|uniref:Uncharacterized protein n=1 Tax=Allocoleopsis franciscana PCC 7113 TaxID=1173027 RepID=K9WEA4_9CYAN|nr:hypothetical protein [Allocoleopsis franciscana]AFZ18074.1 hypothetical protein Mic7113_2262 [Allocoleopsis franciscana PCC 7113]
MKNLISSAFVHISSWFQGLQVKRFFAVVIIGFLVLTNNLAALGNNKALAKEGESVRPTTTNEWYEEARETEDAPGERLQNIAEESAQAIKQFGSVYPETAKKSANALDEDKAQNQESSNPFRR